MWSVCSRRRLASHASRMWRAESLRVVRPLAGDVAVHLRREHDLLAPAAALREPAADDLLGLAAAVAVGGVEEVDPALEGAVHDREAVGLARLRPEVHRAEAQRAHEQASTSEMAVVHGGTLCPDVE